MKFETLNYLFATPAVMDASDNIHDEECNLEELIKCVSIGQTCIDHTSGKCKLPLRETKNLDCKKKIFLSDEVGDFNPLILQSNVTDEGNLQDEQNSICKKCKHESSSEVQEVEIAVNTCSSEATLDASNARLKRKRHLFDSESHCLLKINDKLNMSNKGQDSSSTEQSRCSVKNIASSINDKSDQDLNESNIFVRLLSAEEDSPAKDFSSQSENSSLSKPCIDDNGVYKRSSPSLPDITQLTLNERKYTEEFRTMTSEPSNKDDTLHNESLTDMPEEICSALVMSSNNTSGEVNNESQQPSQRRKRKSDNSNETEPRSLRKRIRKTLPPVKARQTPMGLPKPLRIKKDKFSLEEIYTNKNYSTPIPKQLETIFEYPKEDKDGSIKYVEKRRKHRAVYFATDPAQRPTKKKSKYKKRSTRRNKREADVESDNKLIQVLSDLDQHFLATQLTP